MKRLRTALRSSRRGVTAIAVSALAISGMATIATAGSAAAAGPVTHAVSTTTNVTYAGEDAGNGRCLHGANGTEAEPEDVVNCNQYSSKKDVWVSNLPTSLKDGEYFFAVLAPGGQRNPNDGGDGNLSDDVDTKAARKFTMAGGQVTGAAGHHYFNGRVQLWDFADTPNPGGVYILSVCAWNGGNAVTPSSCKYDAFKVIEGDDTECPPDTSTSSRLYGSEESGESYESDDCEPNLPAEPLQVFKEADGTYETTYSWGIDKAVDKSGPVSKPSGSVTANYTVTLTQTSSSVGAFTLADDVQVYNPNPGTVEASLADTLSNNESCEITGSGDENGEPVPFANGLWTMQPGSNYFTYECDLSTLNAIPSGLSNTATAAWAAQPVTGTSAAGLLAGSANSGAVPVSFSESAAHRTCVDVTDAFDGGSPVALVPGQVCLGDLTNHQYTWPTYSRDLPVPNVTPTSKCKTYDNTAAFAASDAPAYTGSDTASVQVCRSTQDLGARTIGFWSNKNGQGIITGSDKVTRPGQSVSICIELRNNLRGYAPFRDLSATAKCADVATWTLKIIKAADASGSSMNAMLKAQMMATALDVFFTGQGKYAGAQAFLPAKAIGDALVDLNPVGNSADARGAFGGVDAITVSGALTYAASQSNDGGTSWYGQVKTTQEKAKNFFDAVNNNVTYGYTP